MNSTDGSPLGLVSDSTHGSLYKLIGVTLAITSGIFIGSSFVFKKKGLLESNQKSGRDAGDDYGYLKSPMWWSGMILMVVGEACNFVAYAFTQAILVTPLGAISVVLSAVLSSIFLKERLTFQGKVGCLQCVLG
ncbi:Magnesium transporter NIPA2, partial [Choanephora cucurbitarum]